MFSLKYLRLREQRRQPLQKFSQKAPQPPALKPPSTARTAGRSDRVERRFRRQPFILLLVGASSISLVSAESGENSLIPLRLLFPPNPLRWASAGALLSSDNRLIYPKYAEGVRPIWRGKVLFRSVSNHTPTNAATLVLLGLSGYTLHLTNRIAHSGSQGETRAFRAGVVSLPSGRFARFRNPAWPGVRTAYFAVLCTGGVCGKEAESLLDIDARTVRRCPEATRSRRNAQPRCWFLRCIGELHGLPSLHPRAERKICCWGCLVFACGVGNSSLVTAVRFLNRCSHRSMRETYPLGQRSGCRS